MKPGIDVFCAWGDGPDVGINLRIPAYALRGDLMMVDLTADEALAMSEQLRNAALAAKKMDETCREHDESAAITASLLSSQTRPEEAS